MTREVLFAAQAHQDLLEFYEHIAAASRPERAGPMPSTFAATASVC